MTAKVKSEATPRLDAELADTFPASDPPSVTQPGTGVGGPMREDVPARPVVRRPTRKARRRLPR